MAFGFTYLTGTEIAGYTSINALIASIDTQLTNRIPNEDTSGSGAYNAYVPIYDSTQSSGFTQSLIGTSNIADSAITSAKIANGAIVDADIATGTITDSKLATIATAGKVSNTATSALSTNTANAIVTRDASGNFSANTITANLTGNAATVTTNANLTGPITSVGNATSITANTTLPGAPLIGTANGSYPQATNLSRVSTIQYVNDAVVNVNSSLSSTSLTGEVGGTVGATVIRTDASVDANRPVSTNAIKDSAVTNAKLAGSITPSKVTGTAITAADVGTVTNTMLGSIAAAKVTGTAITAADVGTVTSAMILDNTIVASDISSSYPGHQVLTTTQKNALTGVTTGTMVYDSGLGLFQYWNGSAWVVAQGSPPIFTTETARNTAITTPIEGTHAYITASADVSASGSTVYLPSGIQTIHNGSSTPTYAANWVCVTPVGCINSASGTIGNTGFTTTLGGTPGTTPTVSLNTGTTALVSFKCFMNAALSGDALTVTVAVSGATTISATTMNANGIMVGYTPKSSANDTSINVGMTAIVGGLTPGVNTFTMNYANGGTGTATFSARALTVQGIA